MGGADVYFYYYFDARNWSFRAVLLKTCEDIVSELTVKVLCAIFPVLLAPLVGWVLGRPTASSDAARAEYLIKRLDLLERMARMRGERGEVGLASLLDSEISNCRLFLSRKPRFIRSIEERDAILPTLAGRFLLTAPSLTVGQRVFKGLFYFFLSASVLMPLGFYVVDERLHYKHSWQSATVASIIYVGVALLFRLAARPKQTAQKS